MIIVPNVLVTECGCETGPRSVFADTPLQEEPPKDENRSPRRDAGRVQAQVRMQPWARTGCTWEGSLGHRVGSLAGTQPCQLLPLGVWGAKSRRALTRARARGTARPLAARRPTSSTSWLHQTTRRCCFRAQHRAHTVPRTPARVLPAHPHRQGLGTRSPRPPRARGVAAVTDWSPEGHPKPGNAQGKAQQVNSWVLIFSGV